MKKFTADIDIDLADREQLLQQIKHVPAAINRNGQMVKHNTGIYVNPVPFDPFTNLSNIDYQEAEDLGYVKLDLLNVHVYSQVRDYQHLVQLINLEPNWARLKERSFVEQIIHINNHYDLLQSMPEPVDSIPRLAMFIALIRPGKKHLAGKPWAEIAKTIWDRNVDGYTFRKSHAVAYAHLVAVHINLVNQT